MLDSRFLSVVRKFRKMNLGSAQRKFLYMIAESPLAAYDIYVQIKKEIDIKNVRKTVSKLYKLGLIEIEGYYPRGKVKYRLTSYGLFQLLHDSRIPKSIVGLYKDDIIIQTILFEFFNVETVTDWINMEPQFLLAGYISRCCQACFEEPRSKYIDRKYFITKRSQTLILTDLLRTIISREIYRFIIEILVIAAHRPEEKQPYIASADMIPELALKKDKKFIAFATRIKASFQKGCEVFMI